MAVTPGVDPSLVLPEHGPCLVGSIITLDDASFTTKIAVHSGANALAPYGCVALLDRRKGTRVKVRPWKAGNYLKNRKLVRFRVVRLSFCIRDSHEMRWARAPRLRCHHVIKLLLSYVF